MRSGKFKTRNPELSLQLGARTLFPGDPFLAEGPGHGKVSPLVDWEPWLSAGRAGVSDPVG